MPLTPFHLGVGALGKGLSPERVSFSAFVASQVAIDCETAYYLLRHDWPVHRWCHTFVVAVPLGLVVGAAFWTASRGLAPIWRRTAFRPGESEVALVPALLGGLLGGATHPLLDGIMHWDIRPFRPFTESNPLRDSIGLGWLHLLCVVAGLLGCALLALRSKLSSLYVRG